MKIIVAAGMNAATTALATAKWLELDPQTIPWWLLALWFVVSTMLLVVSAWQEL